MADELISYVPLSAELPEGLWPENLLGSGDGQLLDMIAYEGGDLVGTSDNWAILAKLRVVEEIAFELPLLKVMALVLGTGAIEAAVEGGSFGWNAEITADILKLRFSRSLLKPVIEQNGKLVADPNESHFVEIALPFTLAVNSDGDVDIIWPGEEAQPLILPKCMLLPGVTIEGSLWIVFEDGKFKPSESSFTRDEPGNGNAPSPLSFKDFHIDRKCFALKWNESQINYWLRQVAADLFDQSPSIDSEATVRVVFGDSKQKPIQEIRLDWEISASARTFALPGVKVTTPDNARFSLVFFDAGEDGFNHVALGLTIGAGSTLKATSNFAWGRDDERELQNDSEKKPTDKPLFEVELTANNDVSLILLNLRLKTRKVEKFLYQLEEPISNLDFSNLDSLCTPINFDKSVSLKPDDWTGKFRLNIDESFTFPFLKQEPGQGQVAQFVKIDTPDLKEIPLDFNKRTLTFPVGVTICIGPLEFKTQFDFTFNWQTFALQVEHNQGIELFSEKPELAPTQDYLGLRWRLKGKLIETGTNKGKYHLFTLVTKDYNYQIQQAPGAIFEISYTRASDDPIVFAVSDFVLSPKGINLTATVTDRPAKLNGLNTRFRFHGSRFEIKENQIKDFTLAGSGPLPPDLVGDAIADIALQFAQRNGNLTLIAGSAKLKGNKLLDCRGTRFQFSVDAIGLKFVNDGKFHLYFTLTGSAQYVPSGSDGSNFALALLGKIKIDLVECPLTGDARVIGKHVKFLIELPKAKSFNFLGCFEMELRAIGFVPQAKEFGGDGAMEITGQLKFAQGAGDTPDSRPNYHTLLIGLPKKGEFIPRIHFKNLAVNLNFGAAFKLSGVVDFKNSPQEQGFDGEGILEIQGLPTIAASFAFLRVRRDESSPWVRAWFIYIEARQVSFKIPVVELFIREVGLGFGYRYTLVSIKAADRANDVRALLKELKVLSRTQGDLSKRDRWSVDLEAAGEDPRWTVVLRAMISQTSASASPLKWDKNAEEVLPCVFLFDAVIAFRSDFTFFMAVRAWLNTNYYDYVTNDKGLREKPLFSGFVLLSPRQKRFLAHIASNPEGHLGSRPALPEFIQSAIRNGQFSATLLVEPGLVHYELGWPNMLRWGAKIGPLDAEVRGGFILRVTKRELVLGVSYLARAKLSLEAGFDFGIVGGRISAHASIAYGARFIGVVDLKNTGDNSAIYGAVGLEAYIQFSIEFWIRLKLVFVTIKKSFRFSIGISFTAGLEIGVVGLNLPGLRGSGTVSVSVMGHKLHLGVKLGANESRVTAAFNRTQQYLKLGLEATEVESVPGVNSSQSVGLMASGEAVPAMSMAAIGTVSTGDIPPSVRASLMTELSQEGFKAPNYTIFVIRKEKATDWSYFVLLPQGEPEKGSEVSQEQGFLPVPPKNVDKVQSDFILNIPEGSDASFELMQFNPITKRWENWLPKPPANQNSSIPAWRVNWDATIAENVPTRDLTPDAAPSVKQKSLTLKEYLRHAFKTDGQQENPTPLGDPNPMPLDRTVEDERVHNPSDNSFEAAVRGAVAQFSSSPFFKKDPNYEYERVLNEAFHDDTTVYSPTGELPKQRDQNSEEFRLIQENQQALQLRGMVIHDVVADLREYVLASQETQVNLDQTLVPGSIAFQMGLVFRFKGKAPDWLKNNSGSVPTIRQRLHPEDPAPAPEAKPVRTFNIVRGDKDDLTAFSTDFSENPPQFQRLQQFTDANTIAITWDLTWNQTLPNGCTPCQGEPEHHLLQYQVRRRALDGSEREVVYTIKSAEVLHREVKENGESLLKRLKPRFQVVDHFNQETLEDQAALPATGRSYLYTITPVDFAGNVGRPLTLVATRYPNEPPQVPVNGELIVRYRLNKTDLEAASTPSTGMPRLVKPDRIQVEWTEPIAQKEGPKVAVAKYLLVFRKDSTLPIGSYGLDSTTSRPRTNSLPTTNARQLPTDIEIELEPTGPRNDRSAVISLATLRNAGVFPPGDSPEWRPESWRIFFQTVSTNGVPSALAPVQLLLRVEAKPEVALDPDVLLNEREERRPAELEWLPYPLKFSMLPPEDQRAIAGIARFPMPKLDNLGHAPKFTNSLDNAIAYQEHPTGIRCIRFRWNQGPSDVPNYPLDLNAGYELYELDVDAHSTDTFTDPVKLSDVLRRIQEVQMLPAEDLLLSPNNTLTTNQWEAWYASTILRRQPPEIPIQGSEIPLKPWYSWRESILEWPEWPGLTDREQGQRSTPLHKFLQLLIGALDENPAGKTVNEKKLKTYNVDLQVNPPIQPGNFAAFIKTTAAKVDSYGWGILQRFGLTVAFSLHDETTGELITGQALVDALQAVLETYKDEALYTAEELEKLYTTEQLASTPIPKFKDFYKYLHVELLFQPSRSISLEAGAPEAKDLLGVVQLSLRPVIQQQLKYSKMTLTGPAGAKINLVLTLTEPCSLINQADPASGQVELNKETEPVTRTIKLPLNGQTTILLRSKTIPSVSFELELKEQPNLSDSLKTFFEYRDKPLKRIFVKSQFFGLSEADRKQVLKELGKALSEIDRKAAQFSEESITQFKFELPQAFPVTNEFSTYFTVSTKTLATEFSSISEKEAEEKQSKKQWLNFKRYVEALNSNDADVSSDLRISIPRVIPQPDATTDDASLLPDFLAWAQRFFDASGEMNVVDNLGVPVEGPWLVTAYPRSGSPAYATPDASGRLTYDHLLEDKWAHNYRYYIKPSGRYDLLWQSFRQSPQLFPNLEERLKKLPEAMPDPQAGGLDLVLDRTKSVDPPLVLSSSRLDESSQPGKPVAPGTTWEVIVAQHPEQALIERNQTLARQLAFRHIAFTLLRRFAYPDAIARLESALQKHKHTSNLQLKFVENQMPALPSAYPEQPDRIPLPSEAKLEDNIARSLDIPKRIGNFQQGALALQWEALPFYYEHRLLLVAQTTSQVSSINEVTQRDFEYSSPQPIAIAQAIQIDWKPQSPYGEADTKAINIRIRHVQIPLQRFWDCLPEAAKKQWKSEAPDPKDSREPKRKLSALPDLDVVYQIVETFSGNIEVQAEFFFDGSNGGQYNRRQLGQRFLADIIDLTPPPTEAPQADYILSTSIQQITEEQLKRSYQKNLIPEPTRYKVDFKGIKSKPPEVSVETESPLLSVVGILTREDRNNILLGSVTPDQQQTLRTWLVSEPDKTSLKGLFPSLSDQEHESLWQKFQSLLGSVTPDQQKTLRTWLASGEPDETSLKRLFPSLSDQERESLWKDFQALDRIYQDWFSQQVISRPLSLNSPPSNVEALKQLVDFPEADNCTLVWTGSISASQREALAAIDADDSFRNALNRLAEAAANPKETDVSAQVAVLGLDQVPRSLHENQIQFSINASSKRYTGLTWTGLLLTEQEQILKRWAQIPAFSKAIDALLAELDRTVIEKRLTPPRPLQEELPEVIRTRLQIGTTQLTWIGPAPTDAQRSALASFAGDEDFLNALRQLIAAIDANQTVEMAPQARRPQQSSLPEIIRDRLLIGTDKLTWVGAVPTDAQRSALTSLTGDENFRDALKRLLTDIKPDKSVDMAPERPQQADLPDSIRAQLQIGMKQLTWIGPAPTDAQRSALNSLRGDEDFLMARGRLLGAIDTTKSVNLVPRPKRPRQNDLPELLNSQLSIEPTRVEWRGRVYNTAQWQALRSLTGDEPFTTAIQAIVGELNAKQVAIAFDLPIRPQPEDLPDTLRNQLLIGRARIRYHGLMTLDEGLALQKLCQLQLDKQAIQRLYDSTLNRGLRDRSLSIVARRGSAAPRSNSFQPKGLDTKG